MANSHGRLHIGTSGWHYDHWLGTFYPDDLPKSDLLGYYAERFDSVEINNSFYNLPDAKTFERWRDTVGKDFRFSVKASRYITHMKKLRDAREPLDRLYRRVEHLGDRLGPILFQLPPRWHLDADRLRDFLGLLSSDHRHTFEFRDTTWFCRETYELLAGHDQAFCIYHLAGLESPHEITADFVYVRLHGPGDKYRGCYDRHALSGWMGAFSAWSRQGRDVYCYFDNDEAGYAVRNARELASMTPSSP